MTTLIIHTDSEVKSLTVLNEMVRNYTRGINLRMSLIQVLDSEW